jgi:hypothetical protein
MSLIDRRPDMSRLAAVLAIGAFSLGNRAFAQTAAAPAKPAPAPFQSISALEFSPDGKLFVGDARGGAIFALDLGQRTKPAETPAVQLPDLETRVAALIGTRADDVVVHDLAVDPISLDVFLAVSRNRGKWRSSWNLPNDLGDASELVRVDAKGELHGVELAGMPWTRAVLPKPVAAGKKHEWKDVETRTEAITDLAWDDGTVWVAGLSNEEFSSAIWRVTYPFTDKPAGITTVENYHVAHEKWETEAPIRALTPLTIDGKRHLVAAYLCTPLVLFETSSLVDGAHVKGRTVAEFGSGNYPLDLEVVKTGRGDRLYLANHNLPMLIIDPKDLVGAKALTEPSPDYASGIPAEYRSGTGLQQLDRRGDQQVVTVRRTPGGSLALEMRQVR